MCGRSSARLHGQPNRSVAIRAVDVRHGGCAAPRASRGAGGRRGCAAHLDGRDLRIAAAPAPVAGRDRRCRGAGTFIALTSRQGQREERRALGVGGQEEAEAALADHGHDRAQVRVARGRPGGPGRRREHPDREAADPPGCRPPVPGRVSRAWRPPAPPGRERRGRACRRRRRGRGRPGSARAPPVGRPGDRATGAWPPPRSAASRPGCESGGPPVPPAGRRRTAPRRRSSPGSAWSRPGRRRETRP